MIKPQRLADSSGVRTTAILIAVISVRVQKFFTDHGVVLKLPRNVPPVVYESFLSLSPLFFLVLVFWIIRFVFGVDINNLVQAALHFDTLGFSLCNDGNIDRNSLVKIDSLQVNVQ